MRSIQSVARFKILPGKLDEFKRLSAKCVQLAREKDTGTLRDELFFNEDQNGVRGVRGVRGLGVLHTYGLHSRLRMPQRAGDSRRNPVLGVDPLAYAISELADNATISAN